MEFFKKFWNK